MSGATVPRGPAGEAVQARFGRGILGLVLAGLAARLALLPVAPDIDDSFFFVRGVERFSLAEVRPHWPGYPVYVWTGKLLALVTGDAVRALHLVSAAASALTAWPLGLATRAWALSLGALPRTADRAGWGAGALWLVTPVAWVTGVQIASDPLGLLLGAVFLVMCLRAREAGRGAWLRAGGMAGLMLGARVVNFSMLGPLAAEAWRRRRERWGRWPAAAALALAVAAGVLPWAAWLLAREGEAFVGVGRRILAGHFTRWGGSVATDPDLVTRPLRAAGTLAVYGLGVGTPDLGWARPAAGLAWAAVLVLALGRGRPWRGAAAPVLALWAGPHLLYVFVAQAVEAQPRYMMAATFVACAAAGLAVRQRGGAAALGAAVAATAAVAGPLALAQHRYPPSEYRLARFLAGHHRPAVVVVDAPATHQYLERAAPEVLWRKGPATSVAAWSERWSAGGHAVFATAPPAPDSRGWRPVAHFCRDPLIDPMRGGELWLFAPGGGGPAAPPLTDGCGGP